MNESHVCIMATPEWAAPSGFDVGLMNADCEVVELMTATTPDEAEQAAQVLAAANGCQWSWVDEPEGTADDEG